MKLSNKNATIITNIIPFFIVVAFVTGNALAGGGVKHMSREISIHLENDALEIIEFRGRDLVRLRHTRCKYPADRIGAPRLPAYFLRVVVPENARFESVTVTGIRTRIPPGRFELEFIRPACSGHQETPPSGPDPKIYLSAKPYPPDKVEFLRSGELRGHTLLFFRVNPVQYIPAEGKLLFHNRITFRIDTSTGAEPESTGKPLGKAELFTRMLRRSLENPDELDRQPPKTRSLDDRIDYLIICSEDFQNEFQRLADWKKKKGVPAGIVTTESIRAGYQGRDMQEKIKRCIIDHVNNYDTVYVFLGGEVDTIPTRKCYGETDTGGMEFAIPTDLYYAGLDKIDWNPDGYMPCNLIEPDGDTVDMEPDVFVGRYPCTTPEEAQAYVDKILAYERESPATGFCGEILLSGLSFRGFFDDNGEYHEDPYQEGWLSDAEVWSNRLYDDCIGPYWSPSVTRLYDTTPGLLLTAEVLAEELEKGYGIVNMDTHGLENAWFMETTTRYYNRDASAQSNLGEYSIIYTTACHTNELMHRMTSLGEAFLQNPGGGAVAYIGSSKEAWGEPGSYEGGPSAVYGRTFYEKLLAEDIYHLGELFAEHKWQHADLCTAYNKYRWLQFSINLLGDPELPIWTADPREMTVIHPFRVAVGSRTIHIKAEPGSHICLWKTAEEGDEVYLHGDADANGEYSVIVDLETEGTLGLTATKHNYYPFEADIEVSLFVEEEDGGGHEDDRLDGGASDAGDGPADDGTAVVLGSSCGCAGPAARVPGDFMALSFLVVIGAALLRSRRRQEVNPRS